MPQLAAGRTTISGRLAHYHSFEIDDNGKGFTVETIGEGPPHTHRITMARVMPAGFDMHRHKLELTTIQAKGVNRDGVFLNVVINNAS